MDRQAAYSGDKDIVRGVKREVSEAVWTGHGGVHQHED